MSNIGLFSTASLVATDVSLNGTLSSSGTIQIIATNDTDKYTRQSTIEGVLNTCTVKQLNAAYAYYYGATTITTQTASSGYIFTNCDPNNTGLRLAALNGTFPITPNRNSDGTYFTNYTISIPSKGFYMISGQLSFASNTGGNKYVLNRYNTNGTIISNDYYSICQEPVSYSSPFIRPFNLLIYFNAGESFNIALTNFQGNDVLNFGYRYQTSYLKVLMLT